MTEDLPSTEAPAPPQIAPAPSPETPSTEAPAPSPEAPVLGQARMDVAWGSNTGDEHPEEIQSANTAQSGQIFEQHYTPWRGQLNPRWMRNWAILRHHLLGIFRKGLDRGPCRRVFSFSSHSSPHSPMPV